jgi:hypothetical protein
MWCYACSWDVRGGLTLNSMAQIHTSVNLLTSRDLTWSSGRLTYQHASHISVVAHISWDVRSRNRNMRGVLASEPTRAPREITWRKQIDRSVNLRHRIQCQIASHIPTARVTSHELTRREDSVSPAWVGLRLCECCFEAKNPSHVGNRTAIVLATLAYVSSHCEMECEVMVQETRFVLKQWVMSRVLRVISGASVLRLNM